MFIIYHDLDSSGSFGLLKITNMKTNNLFFNFKSKFFKITFVLSGGAVMFTESLRLDLRSMNSDIKLTVVR